MALSAQQLDSLLQQGAITQVQYDQMAQQAAPSNVSEPPANASPANLPVSSDAPPNQSPASIPNASQASGSSQAPQQVAPAPALPPGATHIGAGGVPVNDDGIPVTATNGNGQLPPDAQSHPAPQSDDSLKGSNSLASSVGATPAQSGGATGTTPPVNNPAQLYMPKRTGSGFSLDPERKLTNTTLGLGKEQVGEYQQNKQTQLDINAAQDVANQAVARTQEANNAALQKTQAENQISWQTAMQRADIASADTIKRAREIGDRRIDVDRYDKENPTGIGNPLAQAFGAMGAALTHSPNGALELYKTKIQEDVAAQKHDIETAYKGLGMEQDENHSALQRAQVDMAFKDKELMTRWQLLKDTTEAQRAKMQSPIDKQKADLLVTGIDDQIRQTKLSMANTIYNFEVQQRKASMASSGPNELEIRKYITDKKAEFMEKGDNEADANDRAVKLAGERYGLQVKGGEAVLPTLENDPNRKNERAKLLITLPSGQQAEARSESAATEFSKRQMAIMQLNRITSRMKELRQKNNGGTIGRADVGEARSLQEQAVNAYNELTGFNRAPGSPEREGLKGSVIPDVSDYSPAGSVDRKLQSLTSYVDQAYKANNITYLKDPKSAPPLNADTDAPAGATPKGQ